MRCLAALHYAWVRASDLSATLWAFFSLAPLSSDDRAYQRAGNAALKKRPTQKEINEPCDGWTSERTREGGRARDPRTVACIKTAFLRRQRRREQKDAHGAAGGREGQLHPRSALPRSFNERRRRRRASSLRRRCRSEKWVIVSFSLRRRRRRASSLTLDACSHFPH